MKIKKILFVFVALFFTSLAQAQFDSTQIKATKISETIYMLTGQGGNIGLCVGEDGVFMVDDQFAPLSTKILTAVKSITSEPLKFVFNTHWHGDHTGGNKNMAEEGAIIIAHKNVRKRMSTDQFVASWGKTKPASPKEALPLITFDKDLQLHLNGEDVMAFHFHNSSHTDGDAILYFSQSNVIHTGDVYFNGRYPYIDIGSGGSINGIIQTCDAILMLCDEDTKIIPGHGKLSNKKELMAYRAMLMMMRDRVLKQVKAGKTVEEVQAMDLGKDYNEQYGKNFIKPKRMIKTLYESLKAEIKE